MLLSTLLAGIQTLIPAKSTLIVKGVTMTQAQVVTALQAVITYFSAVRTAKAALLTAIGTRKAQAKAARDLYNQIRAALVAQFGKGNPELGKFGLKVGKPPKPLTSAEKALRAAKAKVTRELRGTKGSKQKAAITAGTPTVQLGPGGVEVTPNPTDGPAPSGTPGAGASGADAAGTPSSAPATPKA
ncbi:MAG: hypothetical protein ACYDCL_04950 [Myxococcales bacterium]